MTGMTNDVRRALYEAGLPEARGETPAGFRTWISKTPGVVYVDAQLHPDKFQYEYSLKWGEELITKCSKALANKGFKVVRQSRAGVDRLKVERTAP